MAKDNANWDHPLILVTMYGVRRALKNRLDKWLDAKRDLILKGLEKGKQLPTNGPYILETSPQGGKEISWKQLFLEHLTKDYTKEYGPKAALAIATQELEDLYAQAKDKDGLILSPKINPNYKGVRKVA